MMDKKEVIFKLLFWLILFPIWCFCYFIKCLVDYKPKH
jgi:hypothetical protein